MDMIEKKIKNNQRNQKRVGNKEPRSRAAGH